MDLLGLASRQLNGFLYAVQGVGAAFVGIFLTVYLLGLRNVPKDVVYHSEPIFRTTLSILGILLIALALLALAIAALIKRKD
jgi:Flp pilus assembly protein protease CpaA